MLERTRLTGVRLIIDDKNLSMLETISEVFPNSKYQRCTVHFYRNAFSVTPYNKTKLVVLMLKAIHVQKSKEAPRDRKAIGAFPDRQRTLMLVCARLRHVAATSWGARCYMNMDHLFKPEEDLRSDIIVG